jgi:hypothetical protein
MPRIFFALILSLFFSAAAYANPIQYTLINNTNANGHGPSWGFDTDGTFTFTLPSAITVNTIVHAPDYIGLGPEYIIPGFTYITAPDFTRPDGSHVDEILFTIESYGLQVQINSHPGSAVVISLIPSFGIPDHYEGESTWSADISLDGRDVGTSPVPEPSTIAMIGTGFLALLGTKRKRFEREAIQ